MPSNSQDSNLDSSNVSFDEKTIDGMASSEVAQSILDRRGNEIAAARNLIQALKAPAPLRDNLAFFLRLVRKVLAEYNPDLLTSFDKLRQLKLDQMIYLQLAHHCCLRQLMPYSR